ncbi:hypothetical protein [Paraburkholderia sediminicola]|uniref:hypothetical protein n=1 Tax=Paraburkholderia sediminicola TaxID=458836 RepID=UPI0038B72428
MSIWAERKKTEIDMRGGLAMGLAFEVMKQEGLLRTERSCKEANRWFHKIIASRARKVFLKEYAHIVPKIPSNHIAKTTASIQPDA